MKSSTHIIGSQLESLPQEILLTICTHLAYKDLIHFKVNKEMNDLINKTRRAGIGMRVNFLYENLKNYKAYTWAQHHPTFRRSSMSAAISCAMVVMLGMPMSMAAKSSVTDALKLLAWYSGLGFILSISVIVPFAVVIKDMEIIPFTTIPATLGAAGAIFGYSVLTGTLHSSCFPSLKSEAGALVTGAAAATLGSKLSYFSDSLFTFFDRYSGRNRNTFVEMKNFLLNSESRQVKNKGFPFGK